MNRGWGNYIYFYIMVSNSTERFSNRVDDYVRYRPHYPPAVLTWLQVRFGLNPGKIIADIGSGTGISAALFLHAGYTVMAVEPNKEMREKSAELLNHFPGFTAIGATAENTSIPDGSVDAIIAGQAFHWFDAEKSKKEFRRILKTDGIVALIWNERKTVSPFEMEYDELIVRHGKDYIKVDHRNIHKEDIDRFYYPQTCELKIFDNHQDFSFDGLKGRLLSSSYVPAKNEPGYPAMIHDLERLFEKYHEHGSIRINYDTRLFAGRFDVKRRGI
jgi:SAM-dependent methyltransferase